jgi:hypothetical protein
MNAFLAFSYNFLGHFLTTIVPDVGEIFPPTKLASAEGSFISSEDKAVSDYAKNFTWSQPFLSKMVAIPLAPKKAHMSPRLFKISSKASAS